MTDIRQRLSRLPLEGRMIHRIRAVLQFDLPTYHYPPFLFFQHHLYLDLPRLKNGEVVFVDPTWRRGCPWYVWVGEGRVGGTCVHNLMLNVKRARVGKTQK